MGFLTGKPELPFKGNFARAKRRDDKKFIPIILLKLVFFKLRAQLDINVTEVFWEIVTHF